MSVLYFVALAIALSGMVMLDRRFALFFWSDARRAAAVLVAGVAFFLAWDIAGVSLGIFFRGETSFMTGLQVAPEVPLEEVFFLTLLCYLTMNAYAAASRLLAARARARELKSFAGVVTPADDSNSRASDDGMPGEARPVDGGRQP